jgi:3-dehydroquinate dehydratase-1
VVGTIITSQYLETWATDPKPLPCRFVELRVDGFPDFPKWIEIGKKIEAAGTPVFATVRLAKEGGLWAKADRDRWPLLQEAINHLSGVDVELASELAREVGRAARESGKLAVISAHYFEATPPLRDMERFIANAHSAGTVAKIAAKANSPEDLENLEALLRIPAAGPVCVIGMGALGRQTRLSFPRLGSCFTYGYLDTAGAPGQYSAAELTDHLRNTLPGTGASKA